MIFFCQSASAPSPLLPWPYLLTALLLFAAGGALGYLIAHLRAQRRITALETEARAAAETQDLLRRHDEANRQDIRTHFYAVASDTLRQSADDLKAGNKEQISALLLPLKEQLQILRQTITETRAAGAGNTSAIQQMVNMLMERADTLSKDTENLTQALRGEAKVQGDWGESILESLLESSGLARGEHFSVQPSYPQADGTRLRPDVVVHFPQDRHVIIDSKVSLTAYADYIAAPSDSARAEALKRHIASVKSHIKELAAKRYEQLEAGSLDYVLMFMPNEGAYIAAIRNEPSLTVTAIQNRVLIISPANLIMSLQLARFLWQKDTQERNVQAIVARATLLYEKFVRVQQSFDDLQKALQAAANAYEKTRNLLYAGKGNYLSQVEKLRTFGISPAARLHLHEDE